MCLILGTLVNISTVTYWGTNSRGRSLSYEFVIPLFESQAFTQVVNSFSYECTVFKPKAALQKYITGMWKQMQVILWHKRLKL